MDYKVIKALPTIAVEVAREKLNHPLAAYFGFVILVLFVTYLPLALALKIAILVLGFVMLEDILHFMKYRYVHRDDRKG
jgi:hypothetical protein